VQIQEEEKKHDKPLSAIDKEKLRIFYQKIKKLKILWKKCLYHRGLN
jgi:hypothetical protein